MTILSLASLPSLAVILITALFGLADVRPITQSLRGYGKTFDIILGACFMLMGIGSTFLTLSLLSGAHDIKWSGVTLLYGIAGVFFMIGHYAPWRKWVKRERL
ncbi:holin [Stenotrophomonas phage BUCT627]|uniref:Holin n=1 Tax=Stenotrophomonas phage BUCT627 TaxID=2860377 RepID=A0AC61NKJ3_9CAUD|nr:holin [Stenotrophomonas phage BUCT627]QYC96696.1 holin [Stenotrophomonas phage BUCT627]